MFAQESFRRSIYATSARFDTPRALDNDDLRRFAPSVFATEAHASRSDRFAPVPTIQVLDALRSEGFSVVGAKQATSRDDSKTPFTKHLIRLRRLDDTQWRVNDVLPEILLKNANDGTSAYDLMAGLFRIACLNSLVTKTQTLDSVKVRHSGDAIGKVIEGTYRVMDAARLALAAPQDWSKIQMNAEARAAYAQAAHTYRFGDAEGNVDVAFRPAQLLQARRAADAATDLWTVTNVVQENVIRGGLRARTAAGYDDTGHYVPARRVTTREVKGIDQDVKLNRALWQLSEAMAGHLKAAA